MNPRVIIHMEGGVIQWITSDTTVDVVIIDLDANTHGTDYTDVIKLPNGQFAYRERECVRAHLYEKSFDKTWSNIIEQDEKPLGEYV